MSYYIKNAMAVIGLSLICACICIAQPNYKDIYDQWHAALDENPTATEPIWLDLEYARGLLSTAIISINQAGFSMGEFICERVSDESNSGFHLYRDLYLLRHITGIDLIHGNKGSVEIFRKSWREGNIINSDKYVAQICDSLSAKENNDTLDPDDILQMRRYGIYGLPEIIRQIKKTGSRHAYAAYLIMTHSWQEYTEFIRKPKQMFKSKEEKLAHIEKWLGTKKDQMTNNSVGKKIENALRTQ